MVGQSGQQKYPHPCSGSISYSRIYEEKMDILLAKPWLILAPLNISACKQYDDVAASAKETAWLEEFH